MLEVTCGTASRLAQELLIHAGILSRQVAIFTLRRWNNYDNGHTMLEIWDKGSKKWLLWDFDLKCRYYMLDEERPIGLKELINSEDFSLQFFGSRQITGKRTKSFDSTFLFQPIFFDDVQVYNWIRETACFPVLQNRDEWFSFVKDENERKLAKSLLPNYRFVPEEEFMKLYQQSPN